MTGSSAAAGSTPSAVPHARCPLASPPTLTLQAPPETEQERLLKEEADIMRQVTQKQALKTYAELAGKVETQVRALNTGWRPPLKYRLMSDDEHQVGGVCR